MTSENRKSSRFEPPRVEAEFIIANAEPIHGYVLDASVSGLTASISASANLLPVNSPIEIKITKDGKDANWKSIGSAKVVRSWHDENSLYNGKGIAIRYQDDSYDQSVANLLLIGTRQQTRIKSQKNLAEHDINNLWLLRIQLVENQMKLFILALTLSVALASVYFSLAYHGIVSSNFSDPNLSFWRTLVASLPGFLAASCALHFSQQCITIQRIDSYLEVLKKYFVIQQFPREYCGWENEIWKLRRVLKTQKCEECALVNKCGEYKTEDRDQLKKIKMFWNPSIDVQFLLIFLTFVFMMLLSLASVIYELSQFQLQVKAYIIITSAVTLLIVSVAVGLGFILFNLRKGIFSLVYYRDC